MNKNKFCWNCGTLNECKSEKQTCLKCERLINFPISTMNLKDFIRKEFYGWERWGQWGHNQEMGKWL
jgi:hypothetical protein